jgi:hypothetical protein
MHKLLFTLLIVYCCSLSLVAQRPKNGIYSYKIAWEEFQGKSLGSTCTVRINGDSITIINDGSITGEKGGILDQGLIMKHKKTGKWIIAHKAKDIYAKEIGGCSEGPAVIDFKLRVFYSC